MMLHPELEPPDAILELAPCPFERAVESKVDVSVTLVVLRSVRHADILAVWQDEMDVNLIRRATAVMLTRPSDDHATSSNPPKAPFQLFNMPRDISLNWR